MMEGGSEFRRMEDSVGGRTLCRILVSDSSNLHRGLDKDVDVQKFRLTELGRAGCDG